MATNPTAPEQALATKTPAIITTPDEFFKSQQLWQSLNYNVLSPFTNISGLAPQHGIIVSVVKIDSNPAAGDVYEGLPFLKKDLEVALARLGLRKLAECGGISTRTERVDPCTIPNYWSFRATGSYRGVDGAVVVREATVEWDLRDGSDRLKGWSSAGQISEGRKNGLRNCEARAINAVIRECGCGLKQKYSKAELAKPFVVLRVMYQPDMSDPDVRRIVTEHNLSGTRALYPMAAREPALVTELDDAPATNEPRSVGRSSTTPAAAAPPVDPDAPPTPDAVRVVRIETTSGVNSKTNRPWTKWTIIDSTGAERSTFNATFAEFAEKARAAKQWVEITEEQNGPYRNLIEIAVAGQSPVLPGLDEV